jgi:hypothetical protein
MAVLVEALSVIVRRDAINTKLAGGWDAFLAIVPNNTLCFDEDLARVGFMSPADTEAFVKNIEHEGLKFLCNEQSVDIAVVDQMRGLTMPAQWLEFAHLSLGETGNRVAACWLFEGPRIAAGVHISSNGMTLVTPKGWVYERSLSANFTFVANEHIQERLKFLRREDGMDVYLDQTTEKELYLARPPI